MDAADMDRLIGQHLAAEVAGDPDGSVAMYTDDVEHDVVGAPHGPLTGRDAARGLRAAHARDRYRVDDRNVHRPARDFEPHIRRLCRTANERGLGDLRSLRSLLYIAMLVDEYPEHSRAAGRLLNPAASHLATLARLLRLRPA